MRAPLVLLICCLPLLLGAQPELAQAPNLAAAVKLVREQYGFPALGAALISSDGIEVAVDGVRRLGQDTLVTTADCFHLGSCTKAMTATVIGLLVDEGVLAWTTRPVDVFPALNDTLDPGYATITLEQLLQHRAGLPPVSTMDEVERIPQFTGTTTEQRAAFCLWVLSRPPASPAGGYVYSNAGYGVATAMAEVASGQSWEELLQDRLFAPLGLHAVYGWPARAGAAQPWGHRLVGGVLTPHDPDVTCEQLPAYLAPGGDVSLSVGDFAKFVQLHLKGLRGVDTLIPPEILTKLHTPNGDYAMGWVITDDAGQPVIGHDGSAGSFGSRTLVAPQRDRALVIVSNAMVEQTWQAFDDLMYWIADQQ